MTLSAKLAEARQNGHNIPQLPSATLHGCSRLLGVLCIMASLVVTTRIHWHIPTLASPTQLTFAVAVLFAVGWLLTVPWEKFIKTPGFRLIRLSRRQRAEMGFKLSGKKVPIPTSLPRMIWTRNVATLLKTCLFLHFFLGALVFALALVDIIHFVFLNQNISIAGLTVRAYFFFYLLATQTMALQKIAVFFVCFHLASNFYRFRRASTSMRDQLAYSASNNNATTYYCRKLDELDRDFYIEDKIRLGKWLHQWASGESRAEREATQTTPGTTAVEPASSPDPSPETDNTREQGTNPSNPPATPAERETTTTQTRHKKPSSNHGRNSQKRKKANRKKGRNASGKR